MNAGPEQACVVRFHAQQCVEKYLKALLLSLDVGFPRTHDLRLLIQSVPSQVHLGIQAGTLMPLNRYSVEARYPGEWEPITREDAQPAVDVARQVRDAVRSHLPKEALQE